MSKYISYIGGSFYAIQTCSWGFNCSSFDRHTFQNKTDLQQNEPQKRVHQDSLNLIHNVFNFFFSEHATLEALQHRSLGNLYEISEQKRTTEHESESSC